MENIQLLLLLIFADTSQTNPVLCNYVSLREMAITKYGGRKNVFSVLGRIISVIKRWTRQTPFIHRFLFGKTDDYRYQKAIAGFAYGVLLGYLLYTYILANLELHQDTTYFLGVLITVFLAIGCAVSTQVRCISLLTLPSFLGRSGRNLLMAVAIGHVFAGPVYNLSSNTKEVVRLFVCTTRFALNMTKNTYSLFVEPFKESLQFMKVDKSQYRQFMEAVDNVAKPISQEIEGDDEIKLIQEENDYLDELQQDTKRSEEIREKYEVDENDETAKQEGYVFEQKYFKKLEYRCENVINTAVKKCRNTFKNLKNNCEDYFNFLISWMFCWPFELNMICNIIQMFGGDKVCDPTENIPSGFGEGYIYIRQNKEVLHKLKNELSLGSTHFKISRPPEMLDVQDLMTLSADVLHTIKSKRTLIQSILVTVRRMVAFMFLIVIHNALKYNESYLNSIDFDNIYLTAYFRVLDARRYKHHQRTILPLRNHERKKLTDPYNIVLSKTERNDLKDELTKLIVKIFVLVVIIVIIDHGLQNLLEVIRLHGHIEFVQEGEHSVTIDVEGTGLAASVVRSITAPFNFKKRIKVHMSNEECLPHPSKLEKYFFYRIITIFLTIAFLIFVDGYTRRLQRGICAYFYTKARITFLTTRIENAIKGVDDKEVKQEMSVPYILRIKFPKLFWWLKWFKVGRRKCLICEEVEPMATKPPKCLTCDTYYCRQCWVDLKKKCYVCIHNSVTEETSYQLY